MNSLLPIGMATAISALPALNPVVSAGFRTAAPVNSFFSFLKQSSNSIEDDSTPQATPADRALKNSKGWGALVTNAGNFSVAPAENQPIPFKLSFNIFGTAPAVAQDRSRPQKSTPAAPADSASQLQTAPTVALPAPAPLPPEAGAAASANGIERPPIQNDPGVNLDAAATEKPAPSELAFALKLESNGQTTTSTEQTSLPAIKPVGEQPAAISVQPPPSQADPNARSSQNTRGDDSAHDNRHEAQDLNIEQPVAPNPAGAEVSQASAQGVYIPAGPSSPAPSSEPVSAQAAQRTAYTLPAQPHDQTTKTGPANQISISVPAGDQQKVEVRLMDRAGEVRVSVHAPNEELAGTLRQDLGSLTGKLNQSGYTTEAFTPSRSSGESSRDQKNAEPQQQSGSERQSSGRHQQQQSSQQNGRGNRPAWLDELDNSLATAPARKDQK